nr:amidohydrolase family protein [Gemmatimonadota bacterium]NIQ57795.1 amidohydrolase family protein [Gemmatimonadota bacterium]NIU77950.1 amidohydrolase family protein [Gammaproteobacteria bacterium]NIX47035.1 amidohydrolase family protein [Gemmatimonadota bacterium]NIY11401.1 amidohydrolase family protein [Gemmatimonadota bacterium]
MRRRHLPLHRGPALLALALVGPPACARTGAPAPEPASSLIVGARLIDGTGAPARPAAVRIAGDRIAAVGDLAPRAGERVVDAAGLVLAPGFIDTHSHHGGGLREHPDALGAVSQGITTVVSGADGGSRHPLGEWLRELEYAPVAVNVASFAGHGTLRRRVMGDDYRRAATPDEVDAMARLLRLDLDAGALGLSTGLEYDPGIYATTEEVIALARVAAEAGGRYSSHIRSEDRRLFDAVDEAIRIGREAGIPVQISHLKLAMRSLWGRADELLARLDSARAAGVDVTADVYPYTFWQSTMTVLFPDRDFDDRDAAAFALDELAPPGGMRIARYEPDPSYEGRTLAEVAAIRGEDPVTSYMALIARARAENAEESIIATSMDENDIVTLLRWPHTNVGSDGGLDGAHPRGFGAFTRVLGPYVRSGHLRLEQAVYKMTGLAARHLGIAE